MKKNMKWIVFIAIVVIAIVIYENTDMKKYERASSLFYNKQKYEEAADAFRPLAKKEYKDSLAFVNLVDNYWSGRSEFENGNYEEAVLLLSKVINTEVQNVNSNGTKYGTAEFLDSKYLYCLAAYNSKIATGNYNDAYDVLINGRSSFDTYEYRKLMDQI